MAVYQFDVEQRVPWVGSPDGWYYWTNVYYKICETQTDLFYAVGLIDTISSYAHRRSVRQWWMQYRTPPGSDNIAASFSLFDEPCLYGGFSDTPILHTCVRVNGYVGGRVKWYKRFRLPLMADEMIDGMLAPAVRDWFTGSVIPVVAAANLCTATGAGIEEFRLLPQVIGWQLRHGTKRRERTVIA